MPTEGSLSSRDRERGSSFGLPPSSLFVAREKKASDHDLPSNHRDPYSRDVSGTPTESFSYKTSIRNSDDLINTERFLEPTGRTIATPKNDPDSPPSQYCDRGTTNNNYLRRTSVPTMDRSLPSSERETGTTHKEQRIRVKDSSALPKEKLKKKEKGEKKPRKKRKNANEFNNPFSLSSKHETVQQQDGMAGHAVHADKMERGGDHPHGDGMSSEITRRVKKGKRKKEPKLKEKFRPIAQEAEPPYNSTSATASLLKKSKKHKSQIAQDQHQAIASSGYSAAQTAVNDMMRRALEEDQYSALGSVVDTDSSSDDDVKAITVTAASDKKSRVSHLTTTTRLDRGVIVNAMRRRLRAEGIGKEGRQEAVHSRVVSHPNVLVKGDDKAGGRGHKKKRKRGKKGEVVAKLEVDAVTSDHDTEGNVDENDNDDAEDEVSIFGQAAGKENATWVECDKCKKWRRLRGVVDAKKLPSKWYCHMNKNDPDRSKCTAPEEEYDTPTTPESATDHRARKHLRLWVRRLQCNEAYEARMPTMTRGRKRTAGASKEPYEWVRCCNPACGKWRAILRFMDASSVKSGEWYCVLNTWDEKTASCAAPQENLPALGCPSWVMQDEEQDKG